MPNFEWDERKNASNQAKHGLSFEQASVLFTSGVDYLESYDEAHSWDELRYLAVGPIQKGVIVVVWVERGEDIVRIIGARMATDSEKSMYWSYIEGKS